MRDREKRASDIVTRASKMIGAPAVRDWLREDKEGTWRNKALEDLEDMKKFNELGKKLLSEKEVDLTVAKRLALEAIWASMGFSGRET